jgi:predicted ATP-dependent endonuclease of OLD family
MSEIITIENFGPIKKMSFDFKKINILIGDQGTGKSSVAKLLSVIKEITTFPVKNSYTNGKPDDKEKNMDSFLSDFKNQLEIFGILSYLKTDSFIEFKDSFAYLKYENQRIDVKSNLKAQNEKHTHLIGFIPAYREAAVLLKDSINAIAAVGARLPKMFFYFGQTFLNAKKAKKIYNYTDILDVKYKYVDENDIIILNNGNEILIEEASSAINSGIPLLIVFDNSVESNYPIDRRVSHDSNCPYIIIEEPELNCFPTTQKKMMEYFISKMKYKITDGFDYYCRLVITTHSPYILTSLNNLMYAFVVGKNHYEETAKIIEEKYWINPDDVSAYMLISNGTCEEILDREENLIRAEKIDGVSEFINKQFDALLNIELVQK